MERGSIYQPLLQWNRGMGSIGDLISILYWKPLIAWRQCMEERKVKKRYYENSLLARCDRALKSVYEQINPYRLSKEFLQKRGTVEADRYGETYLTAIDLIAQKCQITECDTVIEMGCGRGRTVFFLANRIGCHVKGIDWVPFFIEQAEKIADECCCSNVTFSCEDMFASDLSGATVIYLYGTCLTEDEILNLTLVFQKLPQRTKIITVSYPLYDYSSAFLPVDQFTVCFPWGKTEVYIQTPFCSKQR